MNGNSIRHSNCDVLYKSFQDLKALQKHPGCARELTLPVNVFSGVGRARAARAESSPRGVDPWVRRGGPKTGFLPHELRPVLVTVAWGQINEPTKILGHSDVFLSTSNGAKTSKPYGSTTTV